MTFKTLSKFSGFVRVIEHRTVQRAGYMLLGIVRRVFQRITSGLSFARHSKRVIDNDASRWCHHILRDAWRSLHDEQGRRSG